MRRSCFRSSSLQMRGRNGETWTGLPFGLDEFVRLDVEPESRTTEEAAPVAPGLRPQMANGVR